MGYVDQIGAFQYKGRTIEAYVTKLRSLRQRERELPVWVVIVNGERFGAFPASPDDTEDEIRERIKRWIDEHLPSGS